MNENYKKLFGVPALGFAAVGGLQNLGGHMSGTPKEDTIGGCRTHIWRPPVEMLLVEISHFISNLLFTDDLLLPMRANMKKSRMFKGQADRVFYSFAFATATPATVAIWISGQYGTSLSII
jgi:hypothetical protein